MVTMQAMPCPPTLLAVSLLHWATGAAAALAGCEVWLSSPKASPPAVSANAMLVGNHFRREPMWVGWEMPGFIR